MLRRLLIAGALVLTTTALASQTASAADPPEELGSQTVAAAVDPSGEAVNLNGAEHKPGHPAAPAHKSHPRTGTDPVVTLTPQSPPPEPATKPLNKWCLEWTSNHGSCIRVQPPEPTPTPDKPATATPSFTITDLATFAPAPATITGEPDNLGVAGLPTNFTTTAATHTRTGELFGYPITVRFTPASFTYHYGDAQTQTTHTPGTTWEHLHQPQFTPTDTSHTYQDRGEYTATADTTYTAEIDLGAGYFPLAGTLTIPGTPQTIHIYEAHTALVAHTCNEDPHAPGC